MSSEDDNSRIKLAWLIRGLGAGGAEHLLLQDAQELSDRYKIQVAFTMSDRQHLRTDFDQADAPATLLSSGNNRLLQKLGISWIYPLRQWLRDYSPDVVHCHSPVLAIAVRTLMILGLIPAAPIVYTEHCDCRLRNPITRYLNSLTLNYDKKLICVSKGVEETVRPLPASSEVIVHGVNTAKVLMAAGARASVREAWGVSDKEIVIGMMANFRVEKNHIQVFHAAKQLLDRYPNIHFVFYGQGILEQKLRQDLIDLQLNSNFLFEGYTNEPHKKMSGFDIILLPSSHEGLPVVLMDAICLGIPAIVTRIAGVAEIYADDEAVFLESPSVDDIVAGIARLVDEESGESRRRDIARKLEPLRSLYSTEHYYSRLTDIYDSLARSNTIPKTDK